MHGRITARPVEPIGIIATLRKFTSLALAVACTVLYALSPITHEIHHSQAIHGLLSMTYGGFVVVLFGSVVSLCTDEQMPRRIELTYDMIGLTLFLASGIVAITLYFKELYSMLGLVAGGLALLNAVVFAFDALSLVNIAIRPPRNNPARSPLWLTDIRRNNTYTYLPRNVCEAPGHPELEDVPLLPRIR